MRIIFFGTPNFAAIILESLLKNENFDVSAAVANSDKPAGRKKILTSPPVKELAQKSKIEVLQPAKLKDAPFAERLKQIKADLFIVASYGKIIPKEILETPKFGCINVHGSLLPEYRGASPIQFALMEGKKKTGITIMLMDEGMDTGPVLAQKEITIDESDNFISLSEKMAHLGSELLIETLPKRVSGEISPAAQDSSKATYTRLFKAEDYKIDWSKPAEEIHNKIRALFPDAYGLVKIGDSELRMKFIESSKFKVQSSNELQYLSSKTKQRELFSFNKRLLAKCSDDFLELIKIQPEGKKVLKASDFLNGYKIKII